VPALRLISSAELVDPALDAAISRALMLRVAAGELDDTLRMSRPGPSVAFGRRDRIAPGYADAVRAARDSGFEATERLAGGRAAVFHEDAIHLGHSLRDSSPRAGVTPRFDATAELLAEALRSLGVDAHVGEVAGEYCPGEHSVNARGEAKIVGVGQRVVRGGAHLGGVVVVDGADRVKDVLGPVYAALGLDWRPETTGSVVAEVGPVSRAAVQDAVENAYAARYDLEPAEIDADTLALAERLRPEHLSPVGAPS
jgi:octanoyl-[GcvH]:protein N-octanoyltransferase